MKANLDGAVLLSASFRTQIIVLSLYQLIICNLRLSPV